jgi:hypothetical protein
MLVVVVGVVAAVVKKAYQNAIPQLGTELQHFKILVMKWHYFNLKYQ